jgi:hypothetical protein
MPRALSGNAKQLRRDLNAADFLLQPLALWGRYPLLLPASAFSADPKYNSQLASLLDPYVDFLLQNPKIHLRIEATTTDKAKAIYDYMISRQLRQQRLEYKSNPTLANPQIVITEL